MVAPVPFWETSDPVMEDGLITRGGMFGHQRTWWELGNFIRLFVGGYGSGKTLALCKRLIALALENAPAPVALVSPTFPMARDTTIRTTAELLDGKATILGSFSWGYNKTSHVFTIRHGSRVGTITVYSGEHPERLKGPNLAAVGIDEPFIQDEEVFVQMLARVRHPGARRKEINLTGTPEQLNWGYELAEGELREAHDVGVVHASTRENLALGTEYADRLAAALDDKAQDAYLEGRFVNLAAGLVFHAFNADRHVVEAERPTDAVELVGMDFNVNPMAFCVGWRQVDSVTGQTKRIHIEREYEVPNSDTQDACIVVKTDYPKVRDCYPDPSCKQRRTSAPGGKTDASFIREAGMIVHAPSSPWPLRDSFNAVNGALKHDRLTIAPACKKLKRYFRTFSHELMNKQEDQKHLLDAMRYPVTYLMPVGKPAIKSEVFF